MAEGREISELTTQIRILKGDSPFKDNFPHQRETDRT
jgi:hypothetical protein